MSEDLTFVDTLPDDQFVAQRRGRRQDPTRDLLRQRPGEWAQIKACPVRQRANNYAWRWKKGHPDIETTVRQVDGQHVVYARAIKIPTNEE